MEYAFEEVELAPGPGIAIRETHSIAGLGAFFARAFTELDRQTKAAGASLAGPPFARYFSVSPDGVDVEAVFPLAAPLTGAGEAKAVDLEGGRAVQVLHAGPYELLHEAYAALERWTEEHGQAPAGPMREVYLTGPDVPPEQHRTLIVQPITAR